MFSLFNFSSFFSRGRGSADPICPYVRMPMITGLVDLCRNNDDEFEINARHTSEIFKRCWALG